MQDLLSLQFPTSKTDVNQIFKHVIDFFKIES